MFSLGIADESCLGVSSVDGGTAQRDQLSADSRPSAAQHRIAQCTSKARKNPATSRTGPRGAAFSRRRTPRTTDRSRGKGERGEEPTSGSAKTTGQPSPGPRRSRCFRGSRTMNTQISSSSRPKSRTGAPAYLMTRRRMGHIQTLAGPGTEFSMRGNCHCEEGSDAAVSRNRNGIAAQRGSRLRSSVLDRGLCTTNWLAIGQCRRIFLTSGFPKPCLQTVPRVHLEPGVASSSSARVQIRRSAFAMISRGSVQC